MAKNGEPSGVERQEKWGSPIRNTEDGLFGIIAIMTNRRYCGSVKLRVRKVLFWNDYFYWVLRAMSVMPRSVFLQ
ncbi:hypothetical protein FWJ25_02695 [Marinobacter salinexigens]|uniref:Uncharacterized protein n=1 Tax=Marinobacter salinexigens TaxID=2919747 RepID=A0A5B0VNV4_9GAMM|nr:hypothetical protein [Marinobacter salinexigens]KAA1176058.1 hypothetical protein FWJ25_02695 [Marinobacter salinexigens]